jgi:hypothetical protein
MGGVSDGVRGSRCPLVLILGFLAFLFLSLEFYTCHVPGMDHVGGILSS